MPTSPAPMEGRGGYNRRSAVQAAGASPALPLLEQAANEVVLLVGRSAVIVVADYGSSEGRNSLAPIGRALAILRGRAGRDRAISVVHTDQPGNDFNALFDMLATDPESYTRHDPAVYASAVGTSFYRQILPSECVTLGWSSWAVQWLSAQLVEYAVRSQPRLGGACPAAFSKTGRSDIEAQRHQRHRTQPCRGRARAANAGTHPGQRRQCRNVAN